MNRMLRKKAVWTAFWLFLFWSAKSIFNEFIYMESAASAVSQLEDNSMFDQVMAVKIAGGMYDNLFYGAFALIVFVIWVGPVLNKVLGKEEQC